MLKCNTKENPKDRPYNIKQVLFAYNTAEHSKTRISPYEALFGRRELMAFDPVVKTPKRNLETYFDKIKKVQTQIKQTITIKFIRIKIKSKTTIWQNINNKTKDDVNDLVLLKWNEIGACSLSSKKNL
jgi:hypothetical protein